MATEVNEVSLERQMVRVQIKTRGMYQKKLKNPTGVDCDLNWTWREWLEKSFSLTVDSELYVVSRLGPKQVDKDGKDIHTAFISDKVRGLLETFKKPKLLYQVQMVKRQRMVVGRKSSRGVADISRKQKVSRRGRMSKFVVSDNDNGEPPATDGCTTSSDSVWDGFQGKLEIEDFQGSVEQDFGSYAIPESSISVGSTRSESIIQERRDLRRRGIPYEDIRTALVDKLSKVSNPQLLMMKDELRKTKEADNWLRFSSKIPLSANLLASLFL